MTVRRCIVDDHALFRAGVRAELDGLVDVLGEAEGVEDAVRAILEHEPDVVLLDVHMPGGGGARSSPAPSATRPRSSSWRCRSRTRPTTSSPSSAPARAAT